MADKLEDPDIPCTGCGKPRHALRNCLQITEMDGRALNTTSAIPMEVRLLMTMPFFLQAICMEGIAALKDETIAQAIHDQGDSWAAPQRLFIDGEVSWHRDYKTNAKGLSERLIEHAKRIRELLKNSDMQQTPCNCKKPSGMCTLLRNRAFYAAMGKMTATGAAAMVVSTNGVLVDINDIGQFKRGDIETDRTDQVYLVMTGPDGSVDTDHEFEKLYKGIRSE